MLSLQAFFNGLNPAEAAFMHLAVRRDHVVEDALNAIVQQGSDLKKPLRVVFIGPGGVPEPAQDEGGVRKEFFQLATRDLFKEEFGMFAYSEETRTHWFAPAALEGLEVEYVLVGALLGLAIYNGVLLDARFPLALYQKLLGIVPEFKVRTCSCCFGTSVWT
jgi:ubiquitin-protein ligase E3 A